jgi:7-carboxy-7-deazaguanine synthase
VRATYQVNEMFVSVQGEGVRAGTVNVFVRLSGCNMDCHREHEEENAAFDCDTEFVSGRRMTAAEIIEEADELLPPQSGRAVIFTGGEPSLQLDALLVGLFRGNGWHTAIETNGTVDVGDLGLDWITCSPKVAEHAVRCLRASELKYVRGYGQGIPKPRCEADHYLISPAFEGDQMDRRAVAWCVRLVKENPTWRLSLQTHKWISAR